MNALFIFAIILFAFNIYRGWNRGIIGIVYGVASWIFIGLFVLIVSPIIYNNIVDNTNLDDTIYNKVYPYVDKKVPGYTGKADVVQQKQAMTSSSIEIPSDVQEKIDSGEIEIPADIEEKIQSGEIEIPEEYQGLLNNSDLSEYQDILNNIDESEYQDILNSLTDGDNTENSNTENNGVNLSDIINAFSNEANKVATDIRKGIVESTTNKIVEYIIRFISVVITYLVAKIITIIIRIIINQTCEDGVIGDIVHFSGAIFGVAEWILYLWIILYGIYLIRLVGIGQTLYNYVEENPLLKLLYENNCLRIFLEQL